MPGEEIVDLLTSKHLYEILINQAISDILNEPELDKLMKKTNDQPI